jgi:hypothetical protein
MAHDMSAGWLSHRTNGSASIAAASLTDFDRCGIDVVNPWSIQFRAAADVGDH